MEKQIDCIRMEGTRSTDILDSMKFKHVKKETINELNIVINKILQFLKISNGGNTNV